MPANLSELLLLSLRSPLPGCRRSCNRLIQPRAAPLGGPTSEWWLEWGGLQQCWGFQAWQRLVLPELLPRRKWVLAPGPTSLVLSSRLQLTTPTGLPACYLLDAAAAPGHMYVYQLCLCSIVECTGCQLLVPHPCCRLPTPALLVHSTWDS